MNAVDELARELRAEWGSAIRSLDRTDDRVLTVGVSSADLTGVAVWLVESHGFRIGSMTVRDEARELGIYYHFYATRTTGAWVVLASAVAADDPRLPSLSGRIHAADWLEREAEDHFGVHLEGHPRLGDFVLHDERWQEGLAPMRKRFDAGDRAIEHRPNRDWKPRRLLRAQGAFSMTVGPIHGGIAEPVHFLLESVGEEVIRAYPRLFYKYRAVEKLAEGRSVDAALLLAERFDALHAFAHSLSFCRAVERLYAIEVPQRARRLRVVLAEIERIRSHVGVIQAICSSTGLAVAESRAAILQEETLRLCGTLTGHRYLFGMNSVGGLSTDLRQEACRSAADELVRIKAKLTTLRDMLGNSSSFLDRLEEVGILSAQRAFEYGLVGPVARASDNRIDLRLASPYEGYETYEFEQAAEEEGDGYARLRVLFTEALQSIEIVEQAVARLEAGPVLAPVDRKGELRRGAAGASFGWVESPAGAAIHAVWTDERGGVERYRIVPPSLFNWHGLHLATEGFAFQDFPIILATFGLSVAENDR